MKRVILPIVLMAAVILGSAPAWTQTKAELAKLTAAAIAGKPKDLELLRNYLASIEGGPAEKAKWARDLLREVVKSGLAADPAALQLAATSITDAMSRVLGKAKIAAVDVGPNCPSP